MPIKPENRSLYPEDWPNIRRRILERDKYHCHRCGIRDHSVGCRADGRFIGTSGNIFRDLAGDGLLYPELLPLTYAEARLIADSCTLDDLDGYHYLVIVLTVAHLDHNPANCEDKNLVSLCQRCHNVYDRSHRNATARNTRKRGQLEFQFQVL